MSKLRNTFLIAFIVVLSGTLSSCEKAEGCGTVRGGYQTEQGSYKLKVEFYDSKTKYVTVDEHTFYHFGNGATICF